MAVKHLIALLRHLPTEHDVANIYTDWLDDPPLAQIDETSLRAVRKEIQAFLQRFSVQQVYAADNPRGRSTAKVLFHDSLKASQLRWDKRLNNIKQPEWSGKPQSEVIGMPLYAKWHTHPTHVRFTNGESLLEVADRIDSFLVETRAHPILVLSHTTPMQVILCNQLRIDYDRVWCFKFDHLAFTLIYKNILLRYNSRSISDVNIDELKEFPNAETYLTTDRGPSLGVVSSLIAWEFTVNWKWASVSIIILIAAIAALLSFPVMFTNVFLRLNRSGIQRIYISQYIADHDIRSTLSRNVREIDILTIRGFGIFALKDSLVYNKVSEANQELRLRILLLDPASHKYCQRAIEIGEGEREFVERLNTAIGAVRELRRFQTHNIECRLYDRLPVWRIVPIDDCMFVSSFLPRLEGHMTTMYRIHRGSVLSLFSSFRRQFDDIWDASAPKTI